MTSASAQRLVAELERSRRLHAERAASTTLAAKLDLLARFQSLRLSATYLDLERLPRYASAIAFFRADLYGPGDFSRRDADLARIVPMLVRTLPEAVISTVADAMQLSALSHELDRTLLERLDGDLTVARYCAAYRRCANRYDREQQIALIGAVGHGLDRYVRSRMLRSTLVVMRLPARASGLGALQEFLERGMSAFARMRGADEFLGIIQARESALMRAIFEGNDAAFADPRI